jgi:hypothetical protein
LYGFLSSLFSISNLFILNSRYISKWFNGEAAFNP